RFQLAAEALNPGVKMIAPWRMESFRSRFPGRTEMLEYCSAKNIPVKATASKPYSSDENVLHITYEAGKLEDPAVDGIPVIDFGMTVSPQEAPDQEEQVTITFEHGMPTSVRHAGGTVGTSGATPACDIVTTLNQIGGRNGVGRIDIVEN